MNENHESYDLAALRQLLLAAFQPKTLRRFCKKRRRFRPIVEDFAPGDGLGDMVDKVIDYCDRHALWPELLAWLEQRFPWQYQRWAPYGHPRPPGAATMMSDPCTDHDLPLSCPALPGSPIEQALGEKPGPVLFTAFYPTRPKAKQTYGLFVYAHTANALWVVEQDVKQFLSKLGGEMPLPRPASKALVLSRDTPVTIVPTCEKIEFRPAQVTKRWEKDPTRFGFEFEPGAELIGEALHGWIAVQVEEIEVAHIRLNIRVLPWERDRRDDALSRAEWVDTTSRMYQRIFVSYSILDTSIVTLYQRAQQALGNELLGDAYSVRPGQNRQAAVARAIDEADVFQLFWSHNARDSKDVSYQWQYALTYKYPEARGEGFIRPVYWEEPRPEPPAQLQHLHFKYVPLSSQCDRNVPSDEELNSKHAAIRRLLLQSFSSEELQRLCYDHPILFPVTYDFGRGQGVNDMVDRLVEYCQRRGLFAELLAVVKEERPGQYARFAEIAGDRQA